jgi:hypothetical protein
MASKSKYPASDQIRHAISRIYKDPFVGLNALGAEKKTLPSSWYEDPISSQVPYIERIRALVKKHEDWVCLLADQMAEFDSREEEVRLQAEARATLMALRELFMSFPEAFEKKSESM